jgi:hypothetical protein
MKKAIIKNRLTFTREDIKGIGTFYSLTQGMVK